MSDRNLSGFLLVGVSSIDAGLLRAGLFEPDEFVPCGGVSLMRHASE